MANLILVADDDRIQCALLERWLRDAGYEVRAFRDGASCLAELERSLPAAICLDLAMPGLDGLSALSEIRRRDAALPVLILTSDAGVDKVVAAMRLGAFDYLVKPVDRSRLLASMQLAIERFRHDLQAAELEREANAEWASSGMAGQSPEMRDLFRQMDRLAKSDISVLIHGESGTGKELVARALHQASQRRQHALVAVNCAAIPETLQESELFGHERGAFTGATERRKGKIELAAGGTLFLDEIGEISPSLQAKLLRVLQEKRFQRVGGSTELASDFRLIAATHRRLSDEVAAGRFREDLYFRVAVFELEVPPLRARGDDVLLLAHHFLAEITKATGQSPVEIAPEAARLLRTYPFPGNVRELQNAIQRALVIGDGRRLEYRDLPAKMVAFGDSRPSPEGGPDLAGPVPAGSLPAGSLPLATEAGTGGRPATLEEIERDAIRSSLERNAFQLTRVARELGIDRSTLYRKLRKLEIAAAEGESAESD